MKSVVSRWSKAVAVALLLLLQLLPATPALAQGGDWTTKTLMPAARAWAAAGVINGVLYVAGGHDGTTGGTTTLQAYNPVTNTWSTLTPMPGRRYQADGAGVIDGELYVAGGWNYPDSGIPQSQLFIYNPGTNSWSSKASMPTLSANGASGVINGKLYVTSPAIGYSGWYKFLHVYDPATDKWSQLTSSPNAHASPAFGVIDNKLYVAGGMDDSGTHAKLDVYDPTTNNWITKAPMPAAGEGFASAVINGKLYAIGGNIAGASSNTVYVYDPSTDKWTTESAMPTSRSGATAGVINGVLYVAGGSNSTGTLATVEAFTETAPPIVPNTYTISASVGANGSIAPSGSMTVNSGASQTFTITPNTGYHVADVLVDGSSVGAVPSYTFTNVTTNHTIAASFIAIPTPTTSGGRSMPDPSSYVMVSSGLAAALLYVGISRLRRRLNRSR